MQNALWAGFMAILAEGVGFAVRGGIFANWKADFGFTDAQLGAIGGAGFSGFCFGIIIGGVLCDKFGYGKLVVTAFTLHVVSAFVTFAATKGMPQTTAYNYLYWGMFIFAYANGTLEGVANPLVATLFPKNRTHYLNILHASWPAGLVLGGVIGWVLGDKFQIGWKIQLSLYLVPTFLYGVLFFGQRFPKSEASVKGLSIGEMFKDVGVLGGLVICGFLVLFFKDALHFSNPLAYGIGAVLLIAVGAVTRFSIGHVLLFVLFITHALIGAVELGTDGWIQNITGNILTSEQGKILFVFTSCLMFCLRFCAHFIEKTLKLSPVGLLFVCAITACIGLNLVSAITTFAAAIIAVAVYALGKTFFWPTMLAVASDRFPRTGAIAISIMGGIGMMSAGLIGSTGLGYAKDRYAGEALNSMDKAVYEQYKADSTSKFLVFKDVQGLDGAKLGAVQGRFNDARKIIEDGKVPDLDPVKLAKLPDAERKAAEDRHAHLKELEAILNQAGALKAGGNSDLSAATAVLSDGEKKVQTASIAGDRRTLKADSAIPAMMAAIYLLLLLYFKTRGGYKRVHIEGTGSHTAEVEDKEPAAI